jgi:hypothetical protein
MTIRLHRGGGDLPDLARYQTAQSRSTPRPWGLTRAATVVRLLPRDASADVTAAKSSLLRTLLVRLCMRKDPPREFEQTAVTSTYERHPKSSTSY